MEWNALCIYFRYCIYLCSVCMIVTTREFELRLVSLSLLLVTQEKVD